MHKVTAQKSLKSISALISNLNCGAEELWLLSFPCLRYLAEWLLVTCLLAVLTLTSRGKLWKYPMQNIQKRQKTGIFFVKN